MPLPTLVQSPLPEPLRGMFTAPIVVSCQKLWRTSETLYFPLPAECVLHNPRGPAAQTPHNNAAPDQHQGSGQRCVTRNHGAPGVVAGLDRSWIASSIPRPDLRQDIPSFHDDNRGHQQSCTAGNQPHRAR